MGAWKSRYLDITTAKVCPVNCYPYCPQPKFRDAYGDATNLLSFDDFALALSHVPKDVGIAFSGFCEPFMNPRAPEMIRLAKAQGHEVRIYTTLVGLRLQDVAELKGCDEYLVLHLPDNKGISHIPTTEGWRATLAEVLTTLRVDHFMNMGDGFVSNDRGGNSYDAKPRHVKGPFHCDLLQLPQPVMLPNLDVAACWMDFALRHKVGNLKEQTYDEIVSGEPFRTIVSHRWRLNGTELCRSCKMATPMYKWIPQSTMASIVSISKRTRQRNYEGV